MLIRPHSPFVRCPPSDAIGAGVPDSPAEPSFQVFATGKDRGAERSVRVPLQGLAGAEDEQEAGKDTGGSPLCLCTGGIGTLRESGHMCDSDNQFPLELCGAAVSFHSATLPVFHISIESCNKPSKARTWQRYDL